MSGKLFAGLQRRKVDTVSDLTAGDMRLDALPVGNKRVAALYAAGTAAMILVACTGNRAAVDRVDQLTQAQLAQAFCTVDALPEWSKLDKVRLPAEFRDLGATFLRRRGHVASLHVSGALDDVVSMEFINVGRAGFKKYIWLIPGEVQPRRTLWEAPATYVCAHRSQSRRQR